MSTKRSVIEHAAIVETLGCKVIELLHGGKHPKLRIRTPGGNEIMKSVSGSPGDGWRGLRNWKTQLRRDMRRIDNGDTK